MLYGPSGCQLIPPAAGATSAACACARLTSAALTGWAELCLRSRYSSGSALPYGLSASGACASAFACGPAGRVAERVSANVATVTTSRSAATANPAVCRRDLCCIRISAIPPCVPTLGLGATLSQDGEMSNRPSVQSPFDRCLGHGGALGSLGLDRDARDLWHLAADRGLELVDRDLDAVGSQIVGERHLEHEEDLVGAGVDGLQRPDLQDRRRALD